MTAWGAHWTFSGGPELEVGTKLGIPSAIDQARVWDGCCREVVGCQGCPSWWGSEAYRLPKDPQVGAPCSGKLSCC